MAYSTIIFDLYGTLVGGFSMSEHERVIGQMARALDAPDPAHFAWRFTHDTWPDRGTGRLPTIQANIEQIFHDAGWPVDGARIAEAVRLRREFTAASMAPLPGALETMAWAQARGYRMALMSDCSEETPLVWPQTPFAPYIEVAVFSCEVGALKPDPRIYAAACERLGVAPAGCIYTGDRIEELEGARAVGMRAVWSQPPHWDTYEALGAAGARWDGEVIPNVGALPRLLIGSRG